MPIMHGNNGSVPTTSITTNNNDKIIALILVYLYNTI